MPSSNPAPFTKDALDPESPNPIKRSLWGTLRKYVLRSEVLLAVVVVAVLVLVGLETFPAVMDKAEWVTNHPGQPYVDPAPDTGSSGVSWLFLLGLISIGGASGFTISKKKKDAPKSSRKDV